MKIARFCLLLLAAAAWTSHAAAKDKKAMGQLVQDANQQSDAAADPNLERAGAKAAIPNDGGTVGGGPVNGTSDKYYKGKGAKGSSAPEVGTGKGAGGVMRSSESHVGSDGPTPPPLPPPTPAKKSILDKYSDDVDTIKDNGLKLPKGADKSEKDARWSDGNSGSLNNSVSGQKKALQLNDEKKGMDAEIKAAKRKGDQRAEYEAKIKKNEIKIQQVNGGLSTLENAYSNSKKTAEDTAYINEKRAKAKAKIAQWKAEEDYWRGQMEKAQ